MSSRTVSRLVLVFCLTLLLPCTVAAQTIRSIVLSPSSLIGGAGGKATVSLAAPAGASGVTVGLSSSAPTVATVPPRLFIPSGSSSGSVLVATSAVSASSSATFTASYGTSSSTAKLTVIPGIAQTLTPQQDATVQYGATGSLGSAPTLQVERVGASSNLNQCVYLKFDLSQLTTAPASAMLTLAVLAPSAPSTGTVHVKCYTVSNYYSTLAQLWTESGLLATNAPNLDTVNWVDLKGFVIDQQDVPAVPGSVAAFNLTSFIAGNMGNVVSLQLICEDTVTNPALVAFSSKENSSGHAPSLIMTFPGLKDVPVAPWALASVPTGGMLLGGYGGPSSADSVNLNSGVEEHNPGPDIVVRNPIGPSATYGRQYRSWQADILSASPGLSPGWIDNYDLRIQANAPGTWGPLTLTFPNGATDTLTPVLSSGGVPTGVLQSSTRGAPYLVYGSASVTTGQWSSFTFHYTDQSGAVFLPSHVTSGLFRLAQSFDIRQRSLFINRDTSDRLQTITNDSKTVLLTFSYLSGQLNKVSDSTVTGRAINYTYGATVNGIPCLSAVSQIDTTQARWLYGYTAIFGTPFLSSISAPVLDPSDTTFTHAIYASNTIRYNATGRATSHADANNHLNLYTFRNGHTGVAIADNPSAPVLAWTQNLSASSLDGGTTTNGSNGGTEQWIYNDPNNPFLPTTYYNRLGQPTACNYDAFGNVILTTTRTSTGGALTSLYNYTSLDSTYPSGMLTQVQIGSKTPTNFSYYDGTSSYNKILQGKGLLSAVKTPAPRGSSSAHQLTSNYYYTALGNVAEIDVPAPDTLGHQVAYTFKYTDGGKTEALGEPTTVTGPATSSNPAGQSYQYRYDALGNVKAVIDGNGYETDYAYNLANQCTRVTYPSTNRSDATKRVSLQITYLYTGGPATKVTLFDETGAAFRTVTQSLGSENEPLKTAGSVLTESQKLDPLYRATTSADGNSNTTKYSFDTQLGTLTKVAYPGATGGTADTLQLGYDKDLNVTQSTDGRGNLTKLLRASQPTADNSVLSVVYPANTLPTVTYTYDPYGRVTDIVDTNTALHYDYDDLDNVTHTVTNYFYNGAITEATEIDYFFNDDGSRSSMDMPLGTFSYTYDAAGNMTGMSTPWGEAYSYNYDANYRLTHQHQSGADTYYSYNARNFLVDLTNRSTLPGKPIIIEYGSSSPAANAPIMQYDAAGNRTVMPIVSPLVPNAARDLSGTITWTYDSRDQLLSEISNRPEATGVAAHHTTAYSNSFVADAAGNLTLLAGKTQGFNSDNQQTSDSLNNFGYQYDGNGNLILSTATGGKPTITLTYDVNDQLTSYGANGQGWTMGYRPDGLRAWVGDTHDTFRRYMFYDGDRLLYEMISLGDTSPATLFHVYGYGPAGLVQLYTVEWLQEQLDQTYADIAVDDFLGFTYDPQGNVAARHFSTPIHPADQLSVYDAFGMERIYATISNWAGSPAFEYDYFDMVGYGGQWGYLTDITSYAEGSYYGTDGRGLVLCGYRYYNPDQGRFLTRDPIGYDGGINIYAYCGNNPINRADPFGLDPPDNISVEEIMQTSAFVRKGAPTALSALGKAGNAASHLIEEVLGSQLAAQAAGMNTDTNFGVPNLPSESGELAEPGEDLYVGTYSKVKRSSAATGKWGTYVPHHVPQNKVSLTTNNKGITILIPRKLHAILDTTSRPARKAPDNIRSHLAADIWELHTVLRDHGYKRSVVNRQLKEIIRQNKAINGFP